jgi:hypothetical protein
MTTTNRPQPLRRASLDKFVKKARRSGNRKTQMPRGIRGAQGMLPSGELE